MTTAVGVAPAYRALSLRRLLWLGGGFILLVVGFVADLLTGPAFLSVGDVMSALAAPATADPAITVIVWDLRLPMSLMAILVGTALGVAGVAMQTILGNPLADPYTLGISAAAGFGAGTVILTGVTLPFLAWLTVPLAAFAASLVATLFVYSFARMRGMSAEVMVLAGIATLFLFQALQSLVQYLASPEVLQAIVFWLFGSLLKASWTNLPIVMVLIGASLALLSGSLWRLTTLRLGDDRAVALGVDVRSLRIRTLVVVALLTAGAVAFVGTVGFVGLMAPHLARGLVGEDQRFLMPFAAIVGALVMIGASILSKLIAPGSVIPIGIVTAIIGVPFLFLLIVRGRSWR